MMTSPLFTAGLVACAAVAIVLLLGINSFRRGGAEGAKRSNKLMQWRLGLQFLAVALLLAFVYISRQTGG